MSSVQSLPVTPQLVHARGGGRHRRGPSRLTCGEDGVGVHRAVRRCPHIPEPRHDQGLAVRQVDVILQQVQWKVEGSCEQLDDTRNDGASA